MMVVVVVGGLWSVVVGGRWWLVVGVDFFVFPDKRRRLTTPLDSRTTFGTYAQYSIPRRKISFSDGVQPGYMPRLFLPGT
jgi:hypothetical protein